MSALPNINEDGVVQSERLLNKFAASIRKLVAQKLTTIAARLTTIEGNIANVYTHLKNRACLYALDLPDVEDSAHLPAAVASVANRKIDTYDMDVDDGVGLAQLFGSASKMARITTLKEGDETWTIDRNMTYFILSFPAVTRVELHCKSLQHIVTNTTNNSITEFICTAETMITPLGSFGVYPAILILNNCNKISFPNLKSISWRNGSGSSWCYFRTNVATKYLFPELESIVGGMDLFYFKNTASSDGILEFPKLKTLQCNICTGNGGYMGWQYIIMPELTTISANLGVGYENNPLLQFYAPKLVNLYNNSPIPSHEYSVNRNLFPNLIDLWCGEVNVNMNLRQWGAANIISDADKTATLNENIRNHIAARVADRTGKTALTITFLDVVYAVLEAATISAFTTKNWTVAQYTIS